MRTLAGFLIVLAAGAACAHPIAGPGAAAGAGTGQRSAAQEAAIAFWTSGYRGADLVGKFQCAAPGLPALSYTRPQARSVRNAILKWERCHAGYMADLADLAAMPAEARIPAQVLAAMTPAERAQAREHVHAVVARLAGDAQADAAQRMARHASWLGARVEYVVFP